MVWVDGGGGARSREPRGRVGWVVGWVGGFTGEWACATTKLDGDDGDGEWGMGNDGDWFQG